MRNAKSNHAEKELMLYRDQLLTIGDLEDFKAELLNEMATLLKSKTEHGVKQWLRTCEVRKMLGVSPGTLQTLRISRKLSFSKIGGIVFYKHEDIIRLLEENCILKSEKHG